MTTPTRCAVLGDPIAHSLSPVLHRAAYAALGLDWAYEAIRVPSGALAGFLNGLDDTWRGLSLTMPLKRELIGLADEISPAARLAGSANTLVLDGGRRLADNTDVYGAAAAIRQVRPGFVATAGILGGGATATSAGLALAGLGCPEIVVLSRSAERAASAVTAIAAHEAAPRVTWARLGDARAGYDLVVSTIPARAQDDRVLRWCAEAPVIFDVLYDPWPTPLAAAALRSGRVVISGLDLLVHQARPQIELFTGHQVPAELLRSAGTAALAG